MNQSLKLKTIVAIGMMALLPKTSFSQVIQQPLPSVQMPGSGIVSAIPEGTFKGRFKGDSRSGGVHMMTTWIPGCDSCFIATIFVHHKPLFGQSKDQVRVYKAVPKDQSGKIITQGCYTGKFAPVTYTLTPLGVDADGEIVANTNPALVLSVTGNQAGTDDVEFALVQANNVNLDEFGAPMYFHRSENGNKQDDVDSGRLFGEWSLSSGGAIGTVTTSQEDGVTRFASVLDYGKVSRSKSGNFQIEEKAPNIFTLQRDNAMATGDIISLLPDKLLIFIRRSHQNRILVVNPKNSADAFEMKVRN